MNRVINTSTSLHLCVSKSRKAKSNIFTKEKHMKLKWATLIFEGAQQTRSFLVPPDNE